MKDPLTKTLLTLTKSLNGLSSRLRKLEVKGTPILVMDSEAPTVPTGLYGTAVSYHLVTLTWTSSSDNIGVAGYSVYRDGGLIGTTSSTTYNDYSVSGSSTYLYTVDAYDFGGNYSAQSASYEIITPVEPDTIAPSTPTSLIAAVLSATSVTLSWTASSDNVGVSGYTIYKNGVPIATTSLTTFTDNTLVPNTSYTFTAAAFDAAGNQSGQSSALIVNTPALPVSGTWYVATDGLSTNPGTQDLPLSLDDALNGGNAGAIVAGDTVYLMDGTYTVAAAQLVTGLAGSAGNPISFMPFPGARPRIRNNTSSAHHTLELRTVSYVDFYDIEFTAYNYTRVSNGAGLTAAVHIYENASYTQAALNFFNCKFHDSAGGAVRFAATSSGIVYDGCLFYYNGSASDYDWTAHIISSNTNTKTIRNSIFINNAADDIRAYSATAAGVNDTVIDSNVIVNCGSLYANPGKSIAIGGSTVTPDNIDVLGNATYTRLATETPSRSLQLGNFGGTTSGSYDTTTCSTDGRWSVNEANFSATAGTNQVGYSSSTDFSSWFGFASTTIPQGATIVTAYMRFVKQNAEASSIVYMNITANDVDNASAPANAAAANAAARTTASVAWSINTWTTGTVDTPDISAVVQEITDRASFGGNILFFLDEDASKSTNDIWLATKEHATDAEAEFHVTYYTGSPDGGISDVNVQGNVFIGQPVDGNDPTNYTAVTMINNTAIYDGSHIGSTTTNFPTNTWTATYPVTGSNVYCNTHDWNTRYASLLIINWAGAATVTVTAAQLTGLTINVGDAYTLCNAENYYSDRISGVFNGTSIVVPMTGRSQASPTGGVALPATLFPTVGVFQIIVSGEGGGGGDTTPPTIPANLAVTGTAGATVLTWDASTDAAGVKEYQVYRGSVLIATVAHNSGSVASGTNGDPVPGVGDFYVSTTGSSLNVGSSASPWSIAYLLAGAGGNIGADDVVWIRAGTYSMNAGVSMAGTSGHPLRVLAYPDERVYIKSITSQGSTWTLNSVQYTEFWNLEFDWPTYDRSVKNNVDQPDGACVQDQTSIVKTGVKFHGCMFRNAWGQGFRNRPVNNVTFDGCHFYYNGAGAFDHGLYIWNIAPYTKTIKNCLFHHNAGHDIHGYNTSSTQSEDNMTVNQNVFWQTSGLYSATQGRSILLGDDASTTNDNTVTNNYTNSDLSTGVYNQAIRMGYSGNGWYDNTITNNVFVGQQIELSILPRTGNVVSGNLMYGCTAMGDSQSAFPSNTWASKPTSGTRVACHAYTYNDQRGNIIVYNWASAIAVTVTHAQLTAGSIDIANGDVYNLHCGEDYFGDVITGTYDGVSINVPMTGHTMETPVGISAPTSRSSFPEFGVFVIEVFKSGSTTPGTQTYTDATTSAGNTYSYTVAAVDNFNNVSGLSVPDTISV